MKSKRHPLSIAWDNWSRSDEGLKCLDPKTLGLDSGKAVYLANRLNRAFQAGADASEKARHEP